MSLTPEQKLHFREKGYLPYTRVLSDTEVETLRQRCEDIAYGRMGHVPKRYIQLEAAFRDTDDSPTDPLDLLPDPVPIELAAGSCMFHHGLNFHRTGANPTPHRRRGLALHYLRSETMYLGTPNEEQRLIAECGKPPGEFRFMLIRGREFPGRV